MFQILTCSLAKSRTLHYNISHNATYSCCICRTDLTMLLQPIKRRLIKIAGLCFMLLHWLHWEHQYIILLHLVETHLKRLNDPRAHTKTKGNWKTSLNKHMISISWHTFWRTIIDWRITPTIITFCFSSWHQARRKSLTRNISNDIRKIGIILAKVYSSTPKTRITSTCLFVAFSQEASNFAGS